MNAVKAHCSTNRGAGHSGIIIKKQFTISFVTTIVGIERFNRG